MRNVQAIPSSVGIHNLSIAVSIAGVFTLAAGESITVDMTKYSPLVKSQVWQSIVGLETQGLIEFTDATTLTAADTIAGAQTTDTLALRPSMPGFTTLGGGGGQGPRFVSATMAVSNAGIVVTLDQEAWGDDAHVNPISYLGLNFTFHANGGTASGIVINFVTDISQHSLKGNTPTKVFRFDITVTGMANGDETVVITPHTNSIYSLAGKKMPTSESITVHLLAPLPGK